jgi:hypothetical protein
MVPAVMLYLLLSQTNDVVVLIGKRTGLTANEGHGLAKKVSSALKAADVSQTRDAEAARAWLAANGVQDSASCAGAKDCIVAVGRKLGVPHAIAASLSRVGKRGTIDLELFVVETGALLEHATVPFDDRGTIETEALLTFTFAVKRALQPPTPVAEPPRPTLVETPPATKVETPLKLKTQPSAFVMNLAGVGLSDGRLRAYTSQLTNRMRARGFRVQSSDAIAAVLGLERQKQLLGCSEGACAVELGAALGVDFVCTGNVIRVDESLSVTLKLVRSDTGGIVASSDAQGTAESFDDVLKQAADGLGDDLGLAAPPARLGRGWLIAPAALGVGALVASGILFGVAGGTYRAIPQKPPATAIVERDAIRLAEQGQREQTWAWGLAIGGSVAVAVSAVLFVALAPPTTQVSLLVSPHGTAVAVGGVW